MQIIDVGPGTACYQNLQTAGDTHLQISRYVFVIVVTSDRSCQPINFFWLQELLC